MKIIITEEQSNEMIPLAIRRRIPDIDETLYEWLYNTNIGDDSENYERLNYIDYVVELLFDEYFLKAAENMNQEEIDKYIIALINIFGDRIGNYWDNYHDGPMHKNAPECDGYWNTIQDMLVDINLYDLFRTNYDGDVMTFKDEKDRLKEKIGRAHV